jgi:hypothetical protein
MWRDSDSSGNHYAHSSVVWDRVASTEMPQRTPASQEGEAEAEAEEEEEEEAATRGSKCR